MSLSTNPAASPYKDPFVRFCDWCGGEINGAWMRGRIDNDVLCLECFVKEGEAIDCAERTMRGEACRCGTVGDHYCPADVARD